MPMNGAALPTSCSISNAKSGPPVFFGAMSSAGRQSPLNGGGKALGSAGRVRVSPDFPGLCALTCNRIPSQAVQVPADTRLEKEE